MSEKIEILHIDDDPDFRTMVYHLLTPSGLKVMSFDSGRSAMDWLHSHTPSLIVSDLNMSPMSGLQVLAAIRNSPTLARIPFVLFSGDPGTTSSTSIPFDADACVIKTKPGLLRSTVFNLLGHEARLVAAKIAVAAVKTSINESRQSNGRAPVPDQQWDELAASIATHQRGKGLVNAAAVVARVQSLLEGSP